MKLDEELYIKQARKEDIEAIERIYAHRVSYNDAHGIHQWTHEQVTWMAFSKLYSIQDYYVGKVQGQVVCGFFIVDVDTLYWPDEKKGSSLYLHKICVDPSFSKRGFSDALITFFKNMGKKQGYHEVRLDVREKKTKLREMYERNGFTLVKIDQFVPEFTTALYHYVY